MAGTYQDLVNATLSEWSQWVQNKAPYKWGGAAQFAADCSGAINRIFLDAGISVGGFTGAGHGPTSEDMATFGVAVPLDQLQPGDITLYDYEGPNSHVGMYAGNGMVYAEPQPGQDAQLAPIDTSHLTGARRFIPGTTGIGGSVTGSSSDSASGQLDSSIVQAVEGIPGITQHVEEAMLEGAGLESGGNPSAKGDGSDGPWQIQLDAHPGVTAAEADDPQWAATYMYPSYQAAVAQVPDSEWSSTPEKAAERAAYLAEKPAGDYYAVRGTAAVNQAWQWVEDALTGGGSTSATDTSLWSDFGGGTEVGTIVHSAEQILGGKDASGNPIAAAEKAVELASLLATGEPWIRLVEISAGVTIGLLGVAALGVILAAPELSAAGDAASAVPGVGTLVGGGLKIAGAAGSGSRAKFARTTGAAVGSHRSATARTAARASKERTDRLKAFQASLDAQRRDADRASRTGKDWGGQKPASPKPARQWPRQPEGPDEGDVQFDMWKARNRGGRATKAQRRSYEGRPAAKSSRPRAYFTDVLEPTK